MKKQRILLNSISVSFFLVCWIVLRFELSEQAMFQSPDSKSYLDVANWIFLGSETDATAIRPMLYPALIGLFYFAMGYLGVWLLQFAAWVVTINLTFLGAKKWSGSSKIGWLSAVLVMVNLSYIALTFQGLTEVITTVFLSVLFYLVAHHIGRFNQPKFGVKLLAIFVALTLVKPVFFYPTIFCFMVVIVAYRKAYLRTPKTVIFPLVVIIPILLQMTLVQSRHGSFQVSQIAGITFKDYYFSQCVRSIEGKEENESKTMVAQMTADDRMEYMLRNKGFFAKQFVENIVLNMKANPDLLGAQYVRNSKIAYGYMQGYNLLGLVINVIGSILFVFLFLKAFFQRKKDVWIPLLIIGGLLNYFLFTTGLSFWQGDRLVLPALALWIPLYAVLFNQLAMKFLRKVKQ